MGQVYTGGAIRRSKREQTAHFHPGERVLYAGAGAGEASVFACERGAIVTHLDRSPAMLKLARVRLAGCDRIEFVESDIMDHDAVDLYDHVCANFFLNVFDASAVADVIAYLARLIRPATSTRRGGELHIIDFAPLPEMHGRPRRKWALQQLYHALPLLSFRLLTDNACHGIYDYRLFHDSMTLRLRQRRRYRIGRRGPAWLASLRFERRPLGSRLRTGGSE